MAGTALGGAGQTLAELVSERTDLAPHEVDHLHRLLESWQLISDLSFADLLLWCRLVTGDGFVCAGQMRPYTAQTLHPEDAFGSVIRPEELPVIDRAFLEGRLWRRDEPLLLDGVPVRMEAIPVRSGGRIIAVVTKEGAPLTHRRPGHLEENYLDCAAALDRMVQEGTFPFASEGLDSELAPRVGDGLIRLDAGGRVLFASPNAISAYRRLGVLSDIVGERLLLDLGTDANPAALALKLGIPAEGDLKRGTSTVCQRAVPFIAGPDRDICGALLLVRDVTELRHREQLIERKEAVIREIHHRVKNNLQTTASLLRMQARRLKGSEAKAELEEAVRRIASIAVVHEMLSQDSTQSVDFARVARQIIRMVRAGLTHPDRNVELEFQGESGEVPAEVATPLAVVLVELLQNAVEHAFDPAGPEGGTVLVDMSREGFVVRLVVADDGRGLPPGFGPDSVGLGLQLVRALVESELAGAMDIAPNPGGGTRVALQFSAERSTTTLRP
jgi:two-component sensor histidine kinase